METKITKKPWGAFKLFTLNEKSTIKILTIKTNERISLQKHKKRTEFWKILSGEGIIVIDNKKYVAKKDKEFEIPNGALHQIICGKEELKVLEISFGFFDEDDIKRVEDIYNRI